MIVVMGLLFVLDIVGLGLVRIKDIFNLLVNYNLVKNNIVVWFIIILYMYI